MLRGLERREDVMGYGDPQSAARRRLRRLAPARLVHEHAVGKAWRFGEPELRLVPRLVRSGSIFVDAGAHEGFFSAVACRAGARAVCFEPNPQLAGRLSRVLPRARVIASALSDRPGEAELFVPEDSGPAGSGYATLQAGAPVTETAGRGVVVSLVPLDALALFDVSALKIDVEGHEPEVLEGAADTIARERPAVIIESENRHRDGSVATVSAFFAERDYHGFFWLHDLWHPLESFDRDVHQNPADVTDFGGARAGSPYVKNFVFLPAADPPPAPLRPGLSAYARLLVNNSG